MISQRMIKFIFVGGLNTGVAYLIYLILLIFLPYIYAYTLSYFISIFVSYFLNTYWVFKQPWSWKKLAQFPLVYLVQYFVGLLLLSILIEYFTISEKVAPLFVMILLIPLTYFLTRTIINGRDSK
jgi:putative flippase GtrA